MAARLGAFPVATVRSRNATTSSGNRTAICVLMIRSYQTESRCGMQGSSRDLANRDLGGRDLRRRQGHQREQRLGTGRVEAEREAGPYGALGGADPHLSSARDVEGGDAVGGDRERAHVDSAGLADDVDRRAGGAAGRDE